MQIHISNGVRRKVGSHSLDVPQKFLDDMEHNGQCADADTHPELVYGSVDFTARALLEPDLPGPFVPSVCFAIETSQDAIQRGFSWAALEALEKVFQAPHSLERDVYLVTFDEAVTFYVPTSHGRFRAVVMPDMEEPFVPVSPESLGVHVADPEGKEMFLQLLSTLKDDVAERAADAPPGQLGQEAKIDPFHLADVQDVASSSCLRTGVQTLAALGGGDLVLFQATVPASAWGPDDSAPEDDDVLSPKTPKTPKTPMKSPIALKKRKRSFLEEMHRSCCRTGVAVSAVTATVDGDASRLHWLPWRTGGDVLHLPNFTATATHSISSQLQHWMQKMQGSAYNCVVKLRCSKGLSCRALLAPWPAAASSEDHSAFEVPRLSPDMSVTFSLVPEIEPDPDEDYVRARERKTFAVQAAILYTNCKGERLLRTHTRSLNVISSVRQVFNSINIGPLMAFLVKQAVMIALDPTQNAKLPRDMLLESCIQILTSYRRRCLDYNTNSVKKTLVTCRQLHLMPLYVLAARKLLYALMSYKDDKVQTEALQRILRMPIHNLMIALYPRVYPLPGNTPESVDLPRHCLALEEQVSRGPAPAYLITNGLGMWYHQSGDQPDLREAAGELAERIREVLQPVSDWIPLHDLPKLSVLKTEEKIMQEATPSGRPRYGSRTPSAVVTKQTEHISWPEKVLLSSLFVEDTGGTEMSYPDWVCFLQEQIASRIYGES